MKSKTYVVMMSCALGVSGFGVAACSADSSAPIDEPVGSPGEQVQNAVLAAGPVACYQELRACAEELCGNEIRDLLRSAFIPFRGPRAYRALQDCAVANCQNACEPGGAGGAPGAGGATGEGGLAGEGGSISSGGMTSTGGIPGAGGEMSGAGGEMSGVGGEMSGVGGEMSGAGGEMSGAGGEMSAGGATASGGASVGGAPATGEGGEMSMGGTTSSGGTGMGGTPAAGGAMSSGGATSGGAPGAGGAAPTGFDLTGTWASRVQTSGTLSAPIVGSTAANIEVVMRLYFSDSGTGKLEICDLSPVTTPNAESLVVTFTPEVIATLTASFSVPAFTPGIGDRVPVPATTIVSGINIDSEPVDADDDGNPGVTVPSNVGGILPLNAYVGLIFAMELEATVSDETTITGMARFVSTGTVFGSDSPLLTEGSIEVTPDSDEIPFTATKLEGDVPCSEVLTQL